jgi:Concanavalin A-like lectin/glucanases superfamily
MDAIGHDALTLQAAVWPRARIRRVGARLLAAIAATAMVAGCGRLRFEDPAVDGAAPDGAAPGTYAAIVLSDQPLGYWRLDETTGNAMDASGHGHNGVYGGGVTRGVSGALVNDPSTAVQLDGMRGTIAVGTVFDPSGTTAFTFEVWIKPTVIDDVSRHVLTRQRRPDPKQGAAILVRMANGLVFERFADSVGSFASFQIAANSGFHHVVATYDGSAMQLYVDGTQVGQAADSNPISSFGDPLLIGATSDNFNYFNGAIDEVAVYPTALAAARVQAHFMAGRGDQPRR